MGKSAKDLNNEQVITLWNDTKKNNAEILDILDCDWSALKTKVTVNTTVKNAIAKIERSSGRAGQVISINGKKVESKKSEKKEVSSSEKKVENKNIAKEVKEKISTPISKAKFKFTVSFVRNGVKDSTHEVGGVDLAEAFSQLKTICKEKRINKIDFYRNGNVIDSASIRNGDVIEARQRLTAAASYTYVI